MVHVHVHILKRMAIIHCMEERNVLVTLYLLDWSITEHGTIILQSNRHRLRSCKLNKGKPEGDIILRHRDHSLLNKQTHTHTHLVGCVSSPAILTYLISPHG